jgi:hypothetical protein
MQEALNNPHYKKIWERMNWQIRHPEAKSLEEALEMEEKYKLHCEVLFRYENITEIINIEKRNFINVDLLKKAKQNGVAKFETLGRPITLFDVISLLNKNAKDCFYLADGLVIHVMPTNNYNNMEKLCDFNTNLLAETTPETWEKTAELI